MLRCLLLALCIGALACAQPGSKGVANEEAGSGVPKPASDAAAQENPLLGRWHSDRDLTLAELALAPAVGEADRTLFTQPTFFGELILEIDETHITTILPYHRAADRYRILARGPQWVSIESQDARGDLQTFRCELRRDRLLVPVPGYGFHEVFVRVQDPD